MNASPTGWQAKLVARLKVHGMLKAIGTTGYIAAFFYAYFWLLRHPLAPVYQMPLTMVDRWVPFSGGWLAVYLSLWMYVSLPPALLADRLGLVRYGVAAAILCLGGLTVFALWPTTIPLGLVDWDAQPGMTFLQGMDVAGNACPSMHVASAVFSGMWMHRLFNEVRAPQWPKALNAIWGLAIVYSTMAVKQHVFLDVLGGLLLGVAVAVPAIRWYASRAPMGATTQAAPDQLG